MGEHSIAQHRQGEFHQKLQSVESYMAEHNLLPEKNRKPIRVAANDKDSIFAPNTFSAFIHNPDYSPTARELKTVWNNFQPFIEHLWE